MENPSYAFPVQLIVMNFVVLLKVLQAAGARSGDAVIDMGTHNDDQLQLVQQVTFMNAEATNK